MMAPIRIFLKRITPRHRTTLARGQRGKVLLRDYILVDAVEAALDEAELDEASDVDVAQDLEARLVMGPQPLQDRAAGHKGGHEADEVPVGGPAAGVGDVAGALVDHAVDVTDKVVYSGAGRVAGAEEEHVEEEDGVVVEKVAEGGLGEVEGDGGGMGDAADVRDAVDVGDDFLQGEVPCRVDNVGKLCLGDGDVPALDDGRAGMVGEQLHVDRIGFVYGLVSDPTLFCSQIECVRRKDETHRRVSCTRRSC